MIAIFVRQHLVFSMLLATAMVALLLHAQPAHAANAEIDRLLTAMMALSLAARSAQGAGSAESDREADQPAGGIQKDRKCKRLSRGCTRKADVSQSSPGSRDRQRQ